MFTESRRTQAYLREFLEANGYGGKVLTFNGTNTDPDSVALTCWLRCPAEVAVAGGRSDLDGVACAVQSAGDWFDRPAAHFPDIVAALA